MEVYFKELRVRTAKRVEVVDITREVEAAVRESGVNDGICLVHAPHATAAIVANEGEAGLLSDIAAKIEEDFPRDGKWRHNLIDDNAAAHLASAFIGSSRAFPVKGSRLLRGVWQNVLLLELDGPRERRVVVTVLGE